MTPKDQSHVMEYVEDRTIGQRPFYQARCACGWSGSLRAALHNAKSDAVFHLRQPTSSTKEEGT